MNVPAKSVVTEITPALVAVPPLTPMQLMQRALEAGNLELVEKMMALQERAEAGAARKAFAEAMSAAQGEMRAVSQDAANPQTRSRYASFANLDRALRPIYSRHGFSLSYDTEDGASEGTIRVVCYVSAHGHERRHHIDMPTDGKGAKGGDVMTKTHATMSAVTYARRGLLKMIFNVAEGADVDDDGNGAGRVPDDNDGDRELISKEQIQTLQSALKVREMPEQRLLKFAGVIFHGHPIETIADIPISIFQRCLDKIRKSGDPQ